MLTQYFFGTPKNLALALTYGTNLIGYQEAKEDSSTETTGT